MFWGKDEANSDEKVSKLTYSVAFSACALSNMDEAVQGAGQRRRMRRRRSKTWRLQVT